MPMIDLKSKNSRLNRRFLCLFRRKKPSSIDITYSYQYTMQFPRLPITLPPFVPTLMSYRWNDEDDCEPLAKKSSHNNTNNQQHPPPPPPHHHHQHIRRRLPKRYGNIIGSFTRKNFSLRKDSINREKQNVLPLSQSNHFSTTNSRRHSLKSLNDTIHCFNSHRKKSHEIKDHHYNHTIKHNDILAQRMQAAMSSELMHSLDRSFIFGHHKQSTKTNSIRTRSHSFNICTFWNDKSDDNSYDYFRSNIKNDFNKENISIHVPTPDYDEQNEDIIIQTLKPDNDISEEPMVDYDDSKSIIKYDLDDKSIIHTDHEILSSFIIPQTSTINSEEQISIPPLPPPLPNLDNKQKKITFHCRTIADKLSFDHKLILKDEEDEEQDDDDDGLKQLESLKISSHNLSKPHYYHISKDLTLRKNSQSLSYTYSPDVSISQLTNHETNLTILCQNPSITDEQIQDCLSSSSPGTSIGIDHDDEHRSSSSKLYNDYKKQASLISIPTSTIHSHSIIIQPMHTQFGLRSSASSTSEKLVDMTLPSKQMNVCVINQLNEHLSTRFRKQQEELCSNNFNNSDNNHYQSYDSLQDYMSENNNIQSDVHDEQKDVPAINSICLTSIPPPPPPPPPLPADGFRPIIPAINRTSNSQRTSIMTLSREANNSTIPCSTGTSTISSNLSDTRILRELRENPLFTRAKQQLEIEPGSNGRRSGRRLIGSTSNITNTETITNETVSYIQLDNYTKTNLKKSYETKNLQQLETIIMLPNELEAILGKRTKSTNDINQIKSRPCTKSLIQTQCRQSELELIFQKRAQRSEQNLM